MAYFKRIIPSLLLSNGRLVKGVQFKNHQDAGNPASTIRIFNDQMADEIIVCDINASKRRVGPDLVALNAFASRCFVPICYGGGIKNLEMAKITHRNKKPLIQIIDEPIRPLSIDKSRPIKLIATSGLIGGLFMLLFLTLQYVWKKLMVIS